MIVEETLAVEETARLVAAVEKTARLVAVAVSLPAVAGSPILSLGATAANVSFRSSYRDFVLSLPVPLPVSIFCLDNRLLFALGMVAMSKQQKNTKK